MINDSDRINGKDGLQICEFIKGKGSFQICELIKQRDLLFQLVKDRCSKAKVIVRSENHSQALHIVIATTKSEQAGLQDAIENLLGDEKISYSFKMRELHFFECCFNSHVLKRVHRYLN